MIQIDKELIEKIKREVVRITEIKHGVHGLDLKIYLFQVDLKFTQNDIDRAISEAVSESLIMRIEYTIPNLNNRFFCFYLPIGSRTL